MVRNSLAIALFVLVAFASVVLLDGASARGPNTPVIALLLAPVLVASIALGRITRSWACVFLAAVPALFAVPFGYADALGEDFLLWFAELFYVLFYALLIAAGVAAGRSLDKRRRIRAGRLVA
jgi:hypothetical protein